MSIELGQSPLRLYAPGFLHLSATSRTRQDSRGRALKRRFGGLVPRPQHSPVYFGASGSWAVPAAEFETVEAWMRARPTRLDHLPSPN